LLDQRGEVFIGPLGRVDPIGYVTLLGQAGEFQNAHGVRDRRHIDRDVLRVYASRLVVVRQDDNIEPGKKLIVVLAPF
jgi:hypothetical protein